MGISFLFQHYLVGIIWNANNEMAPRKTEPGGPVRLHLRHILDGRLLLRLRVVSDVARRHSPFEVTIAHDWSGVSVRISILVYRSLGSLVRLAQRVLIYR
jgi:hypothetical protein